MQTCNKIILMTVFFFVSQALLASVKYAPTSVDMQIKKVSKHVFYVEGKAGIATDNEGFISNAGFIVTGDGVIIFDALGSPSLANTLIKKIKMVTDQPIKKVIISHFHADHIYGLQVFEALGAEIIAPYGAQKYIQSDSAKARQRFQNQLNLYWVNSLLPLILWVRRILTVTSLYWLNKIKFYFRVILYLKGVSPTWVMRIQKNG